MKRKIYSIKDAKAEIYHLPFFQNTHGEAERSFSKTVNDPQTTLNQYPEDYDLWYLGEYDDAEGKIERLETPQHVIKAVDCLNRQES